MHRTIGATDRTQFDGSLGVFQRRQRRPVVLTGRVLTIFRNGPLFGVMTNVIRVSQSAIVRLNVRRQVLTVRCNNCCTCRVRCYFLFDRPTGRLPHPPTPCRPA